MQRGREKLKSDELMASERIMSKRKDGETQKRQMNDRQEEICGGRGDNDW